MGVLVRVSARSRWLGRLRDATAPPVYTRCSVCGVQISGCIGDVDMVAKLGLSDRFDGFIARPTSPRERGC